MPTDDHAEPGSGPAPERAETADGDPEPPSAGGPAPARAAADDGTVPWRAFLTETTAELRRFGVSDADAEARWIIEEVSGLEGTDWILGLDEPATQRGVARLDDLTARRRAGEPIQYVLGHWSFRHLELLCDRRVLIPRPETEQVVEVALGELDRLLLSRHGAHEPTAVDLGTGSGAIALSLAVERPVLEVWGVDASADALAVARANLAGTGMAGSRVRFAEGSWFEPLPAGLRGGVDLLVTNPPYIAADEDLDASVRDWEPTDALISGPTGLEAYRVILAEAPSWLAPGGVLVAEIGSTQAAAVAALAAEAGLVDVRVEPDLAGLDRTVVARRR